MTQKDKFFILLGIGILILAALIVDISLRLPQSAQAPAAASIYDDLAAVVATAEEKDAGNAREPCAVVAIEPAAHATPAEELVQQNRSAARKQKRAPATGEAGESESDRVGLPIYSPDEITARLMRDEKFRRAIQDSICLVLNDFVVADGTMWIDMTVPWKGGSDHVAASVHLGEARREFRDGDLDQLERGRAAAEVARSLKQRFNEVAASDAFPVLGVVVPTQISITRHFKWKKSPYNCQLL